MLHTFALSRLVLFWFGFLILFLITSPNLPCFGVPGFPWNKKKDKDLRRLPGYTTEKEEKTKLKNHSFLSFLAVRHAAVIPTSTTAVESWGSH